MNFSISKSSALVYSVANILVTNLIKTVIFTMLILLCSVKNVTFVMNK